MSTGKRRGDPRVTTVTDPDHELALRNSTTLFIGRMSTNTREDQVYELFGRAGDVRRVIMGLDRFKRTPCGFCFVEYYTREDAEVAMRCINGTRLDDRVIRSDWDAGFIEGRQWHDWVEQEGRRLRSATRRREGLPPAQNPFLPIRQHEDAHIFDVSPTMAEDEIKTKGVDRSLQEQQPIPARQNEVKEEVGEDDGEEQSGPQDEQDDSPQHEHQVEGGFRNTDDESALVVAEEGIKTKSDDSSQPIPAGQNQVKEEVGEEEGEELSDPQDEQDDSQQHEHQVEGGFRNTDYESALVMNNFDRFRHQSIAHAPILYPLVPPPKTPCVTKKNSIRVVDVYTRQRELARKNQSACKPRRVVKKRSFDDDEEEQPCSSKHDHKKHA